MDPFCTWEVDVVNKNRMKKRMSKKKAMADIVSDIAMECGYKSSKNLGCEYVRPD